MQYNIVTLLIQNFCYLLAVIYFLHRVVEFMDNTQLKCFLSVAKTLNFSEAARLNFVSQSTISRYIKDLEKEFGVKLFDRNKRDVTLTNEGKMLLPYVQEILDTLNKATDVISQLNSGYGGKISIAYDAISGDFITKCLKNFTKKYPEIQIELRMIENANEVILNTFDYDFYFMPRDLLPDNPRVDSIITYDDTLSILVPSSMKMSEAELKKQHFILLSEKVSPILYMELMDIFRTFHFTPENITATDDINSIFMQVRAGLGISVLPTKLLNSYQVKQTKIVDFDVADSNITFAMAWRKDLSNPVAPLFIGVAENLAENDEDEEYIL